MLHSFYQTTASIIQKLVQNKFYIHYKLQHQRIFMRYKICNCNRHFRFLARISLIQKGISGSYTQITPTFFIRYLVCNRSETKKNTKFTPRSPIKWSFFVRNHFFVSRFSKIFTRSLILMSIFETPEIVENKSQLNLQNLPIALSAMNLVIFCAQLSIFVFQIFNRYKIKFRFLSDFEEWFVRFY